MLLVGDVVVEESLRSARHACRLERCRGLCCVIGDAGAPLAATEAAALVRLAGRLLPYLGKAARLLTAARGPVVHGRDGPEVATLEGNGPCIFVRFQAGAARCLLETAARGGVPVRRPLSCRLFPLRIYERAGCRRLVLATPAECEPCRTGPSVHRFVRPALVEAFGEHWVADLERVLSP